MAEDKQQEEKERRFDLGLDWDDVGEAYLGTLAALLTFSLIFVVIYGGRRR